MDNLHTLYAFIIISLLKLTASSNCPAEICSCKRFEIASRLETQVRCNTGSNKGYVPVFRSFSQSISSLDLSRVELTVLGNESFRQLSTVRELYLNDNYLIRIEARAFAVIDHSIELLDLQHNKLRDLHFLTTHDFTRLRELLLRDNQLVTISPESFTLMSALEDLNLDDNSLTGPLTFLRQPSLKALSSLNLDANQLDSVDPEDFRYLTNLRSLLVNRNELKDIQFLAHYVFKQLQGLGVANNQLTSVNENLFSDKNLIKWIDLSGNRLTNVSFLASCSLQKLQEIYLSSNLLTSLPADSFRATSSLSVFVADNNQLQDLPRCALLPFYKQLHTFDISNNPMNCSCELSWLQSPRTIPTERQSECVDLEFLNTGNYETSSCPLLPECSTANTCTPTVAASLVYGSITDGLQREYPRTSRTPISVAIRSADTKISLTVLVTFYSLMFVVLN